jgi:hypothetical protein
MAWHAAWRSQPAQRGWTFWPPSWPPSNLVAPTCAIARRGLLKRAASACLDRLPDDDGAVAQLGERVNGIHEVRGSIPLGSTNEINILSESFGDLRLLG